MRKIFRLNKSGTSGASISKEMKVDGYNVGVLIEWVKITDGFWGLKLVPVAQKVEEPKVEPPKVEEITVVPPTV
jgi:hypothetical protein